MSNCSCHQPQDFDDEFTDEFDDEDFEGDDFYDDEESATMPCPYCGREIYEDAEICPECGNYVFPEESKTSHPAWVVWTAILLIAAFLVFMLRVC